MLKNILNNETIGEKESLLISIRKKTISFIFVFLVLINISLIFINIGIWIIAARQKLFIAADFTNLYTGFTMIKEGDGARLYDLDTQAKYQQAILSGLTFENGLLPYLNPPFIALIFSPISLLNINAAFYLWSFFELGLLAWLIYLLHRTFADWNTQEKTILIISLLAFWPLANTFMLGQFSLLFLICFLQLYIAMRNNNKIIAGLWMFMLIIKPQSLFLPGGMTMNKRYIHVAISAVIICIMVIIFSSLLFGFNSWVKYFQVLPIMSRYFGEYGFYPDIQYTLRGILTNILGYSHASIINTLAVIALAGGMILIWLLWKRAVFENNFRFELYFAFTISFTALLSLHMYPHDDLILVLPAALLYDYLIKNNYPRKAYSILVLISPVIFFISAFSKFSILSILRPPVIVILIFLGWTIYYLLKDHRIDIKSIASSEIIST